jgi:hypothetical protein
VIDPISGETVPLILGFGGISQVCQLSQLTVQLIGQAAGNGGPPIGIIYHLCIHIFTILVYYSIIMDRIFSLLVLQAAPLSVYCGISLSNLNMQLYGTTPRG